MNAWFMFLLPAASVPSPLSVAPHYSCLSTACSWATWGRSADSSPWHPLPSRPLTHYKRVFLPGQRFTLCVVAAQHEKPPGHVDMDIKTDNEWTDWEPPWKTTLLWRWISILAKHKLGWSNMFSSITNNCISVNTPCIERIIFILGVQYIHIRSIYIEGLFRSSNTWCSEHVRRQEAADIHHRSTHCWDVTEMLLSSLLSFPSSVQEDGKLSYWPSGSC